MKIYLKNPDTLKSRIKKLKHALTEFDGLTPSLGLCRDLVAQSLNWDDWNDLHLGHQKSGCSADRILFTGRWYDGEENKQEALDNLCNLISEHFGTVVTSIEARTMLALLVWPASISKYHDMLKQNIIKTMPISDIPHHYLRDNILVDVDTPESYEKLIQAYTLPFMSAHGGVMFCKPSEANNILKYFHDKGEVHGIVINQDYGHAFHDAPLPYTAIKHHLMWGHGKDGIMLKTFEHLLHQYTGGKMQPNDRTLFVAWLSDKMQYGDTLTVESFGAHLCDKIHESSHDVINEVIESLSQEQFPGEPMSLRQITNPPYPMIIISYSDDFLGHAVLSAFMHVFTHEREKVSARACSVSSEQAPSLLVTGLGDRITLSGFGSFTLYSGAANWSVMLPQYAQTIERQQHEDTEMRTFMANPMNILRLEPLTMRQRLLMQPHARWYCARNGQDSLRSVTRCMREYAHDVERLNKTVPPIPLNIK